MQVLKKSKLIWFAVICITMSLLCISMSAASGVVYVKDGGTGDGSSASSPLGSMLDAYNVLGTDGGTIVVCGVCTVGVQTDAADDIFYAPAHTGKVTVTSKYNSVDYASKSGARLDFYDGYCFNGPAEFNNITLRACNDSVNCYFFGKYKDMTFGAGIKSELADGCTQYLSIIGGSYKSAKNVTANITIKSGTWYRLVGGSTTGGSSNANLNINISGGTFIFKTVLASLGSHSGNIACKISGGTFYGGVYVTNPVTTGSCSGDFDLTVSGGTFYDEIALAYSPRGTYSGTYDVVINGGDFSHLTAICGGEGLDGTLVSSLSYGTKVDLEAPEKGDITFTNYLRKGADPFMVTHNGDYYYTSTASTAVGLCRVANISDVKNAVAHIVFDPAGYTDLWSPEIHYFSEEEVGAEYAGWYMFVGAKEEGAEGTTASNQRQYVAKCLSGDNLYGWWGDPVTGEKNVLRKMTFENGGYNEDELCGGTSVIHVGGKAYLTFVSEEGRGTAEFHQTINIAQFENPWTIVGDPVEICRPDYEWEMHGYYKSTVEENKWWPKVVEGASPVYGGNGEIYLMYTGSGYWTTWYALGYLKFKGGDPLVASNWVKNPDPILQREATLTADSINGSGHGSYFTDHEGQMWVAYHGYIGVDTSSKRFAFVEPIYVFSDRVSIGNHSGHPAPLETEYTVPVNPKSLREKIRYFETLTAVETTDLDDGISIRFNPIEGATKYVIKRDGTVIYTGTDLSFVDTIAHPGYHDYTVQALNGNTVIASAEFTEVARNNLRFKDVSENGKYTLEDMLIVLNDYVHSNTMNVRFIDIMQMINCI